MNVLEYAGLVVAAFAAGAINAVAGGGSLISFPAMLAAGYSPKTANVTNTVALWPGHVSGSISYRKELSVQRRRMAVLVWPSALGALAGSIILLGTPESAFDAIVPFLILFACALMAFQDRLSAWALAHKLTSHGEDHVPVPLLAATFLVAIYGAYFGAGLGILMLAFLAILLPDDIQQSNALKVMLALIINGVAVIWFALFGPVAWGVAVLMAGGAMAGAYVGVGIARRLGRDWLRLVVIGYGLVVVAVLLIR